MMTGRVPFSGDDPVKVIFSHINDLPLSPRRFAPEIPVGLESLILKLLAKDPLQRPESATEVERLLEGVQGEIRAQPQSGVVSVGVQPPRPPSPEPHFAQPLVGRDKERGLLKQRVDAALRGEGSLVFITGEPGIGKTRLAWEARPYARGRGFLWLEGRYLKERTILLQPWVEAIRFFLRTAPPALLAKVLVPHAAELTKLVPELAERLGRVQPLPSASPEEERVRLLEAISGFFTAISREQPLVLFLDDLQWASSLDALLGLARNIAQERILLLGAYRDLELKENATLARTLLAMNRERLFRPLSLKRLEQTEIRQMVTQTLGEAASSKLTEIISEKTEGNPFFVEEMVRYLVESGAVVPGERGWEVKTGMALIQLPDSVKAAVSERLERLGEETRGVLAWASVAGRHISLPLLQEVTGLDEEKLLWIVEKAEAARVLTPRSLLGQEVYAFIDNQTRETLYEGISSARRRRYHLKVGQAMEKMHGRRLEEHVDALARHFLEGNDLSKAAEYSIRAGDRAQGIYAWERAISHYQTALELLEEIEAEPIKQAEVLEKLGDVTTLGRGKGAIGYLEKALSIYEAAGDTKSVGAAHLRLAYQYGSGEIGGQDVEKGYFHASRAVALLEREGESRQLAMAYRQLSLLMVLLGRESFSNVIELLEKGLTIADRLGDLNSVAEASLLLGSVLVLAGAIARGLETCRKGCEVPKATGDLVSFSLAATLLSRSCALLGDSNGALEWAQSAVDSSESVGAFRQKIFSRLVMVWARMLRGEVPEAIANMESAQQVARASGADPSEVRAHTVTVPGLFHFLLGDWDKAEAALLPYLQIGRYPGSYAQACVPWVGQLYMGRGEILRAKELLQEYTAILKELEKKKWELHLRTILVQARSALGELEEAENDLRRCKEILSNGEDWRGLAAEVYQAQGILRTAEKRWPEAEAAFQKAMEINRQYQLPYYEATTLFELGKMYLSRNAPGDRDQGMKLLDEALSTFQRIQAKKMVEKVLAHKQVLTA
jgi:tetratricopeptide (TPR) repeat protein